MVRSKRGRQMVRRGQARIPRRPHQVRMKTKMKFSDTMWIAMAHHQRRIKTIWVKVLTSIVPTMATQTCEGPSSRVVEEARNIGRTNDPGQLAEVGHHHLHLTRVSAISHLIRMTTTTTFPTTTPAIVRLTRHAGWPRQSQVRRSDNSLPNRVSRNRSSINPSSRLSQTCQWQLTRSYRET